jgi:hypothetical protein
VGGFFMHARGGLETGYLGDEWMGCVDACLEEGAALGLDSWLYDEEGWPSGFAGGLVPARDEAFHGRWLVVSRNVRDAAAAAAAPGFLALYRVRADGSYDRVGPDVSPEGAELVSVGWKSTPHYIDVLNPDAVDAFIEETHERYRRRFPAAFRSVSGAGRPTAGATRVAGFFTDEPRILRLHRPRSALVPAFSRALPRGLRRDVLDVLVALFLPVAGHQKVRYDYYALASFLFVSSFTKRIGDWCRSRGCELTGHLMMEESVFVQAANTAGVMPHYEHLDVPGVDWLRRPIGTPVVPKQVGSAAAQLGKKRVVTESFALAGWDVDFEELKRIVEWQFVNGVNLLCQHLEAYTLRGFRKRIIRRPCSSSSPGGPSTALQRLRRPPGHAPVRGRGRRADPPPPPDAERLGTVRGTEYTEEFRNLDRTSSPPARPFRRPTWSTTWGTRRSWPSTVRPLRPLGGRVLFVRGRRPSEPPLPRRSTLDLLEAFVASGGAVYAAATCRPCSTGAFPSAGRLPPRPRRTTRRLSGPRRRAPGRLGACPRVVDASGVAGAVVAPPEIGAAEIGAYTSPSGASPAGGPGSWSTWTTTAPTGPAWSCPGAASSASIAPRTAPSKIASRVFRRRRRRRHQRRSRLRADALPRPGIGRVAHGSHRSHSRADHAEPYVLDVDGDWISPRSTSTPSPSIPAAAASTAAPSRTRSPSSP